LYNYVRRHHVHEFRPGVDSQTRWVRELEIELTNAYVLRLKGAIDLPLLQAAIIVTGQLDGSRQEAN
jgi:hypothetical protein